jgi:hypothetical protein
MVNVVVKIKFSISIHSHVFYRGLAKFIIIDQYVGFPAEGHNFSFTDVKFHAVSGAPILYRVNVRL